MGIHTERFRELIGKLPKGMNSIPGPEAAAMIITQLANAALQTVSHLEETIDDRDKEIDKLTEMMIEAGVSQKWEPTDKV